MKIDLLFVSVQKNSLSPSRNRTKNLIVVFPKLECEQEHRELAREAVRKTLVLLKNGESADKPLLPLPKKAKKILVAGSHADNLGYQCGGWTITWQGLSGNNHTSSNSPITCFFLRIFEFSELFLDLVSFSFYFFSVFLV